MKDLFLFTIGPVKEFIGSSRKLVDLYGGSRLLSDLMGRAVCQLNKVENVKILIPYVPDFCKNESPNMPNRMVAEFADYSEDEKRRIAENLTDFVKQEFERTALELLESKGISRSGIEMAKKQWEDFLEIYWVFEAYDSPGYWEAYQRMIGAIHQVKGIRPFSQTTEPWGRKCMLFPKYNGIFAKKSGKGNENAYPYQTNPCYVCDITESHGLEYMVKPGEALSALALMKRIYGKRDTDLYSVRYMLLAQRVPENLFRESGMEGQKHERRDMLANAVYDLDHGVVLDEEEYDAQVIQMAHHLYRRIVEQGVKLSSYYAVLKFDGDNMGDAFKALEEAEKQRELSKNIHSFAEEVPAIIKKFGGLPVFAGGEDFLGFIPLDHLFECVSVLHESFCQIMKRSFSIGITIAHLMQPLKEVMAGVDAMEESAKRMPGKNAFAIGIIKRSGDEVRMPAYKLSGGEGVPQWKDVRWLVGILSRAQCSKSMFFNMAQLMKPFLGEQVKPQDDMVEILLRKCVKHGKLEVEQVGVEEVVERLMLFYKNGNQIEDFLHTTDGIAFLSREVDG